jgi:hypothetical protein
MFGYWYWIHKATAGNHAATADGDWVTDSTVWTGVYPGGVNNRRFANWAHQYVDVSKDDLIRKMKRGFRKCNFRSPVDSQGYGSRTSRYVYYCRLATLEGFEEVGEAVNENLGRDLAPKEVNFRGRPIVWVPMLDGNDELGVSADPDYPVIGMDWNVIYPICLAGEWMNEMGPGPVAGQHTVRGYHVDCTINSGCHSRRRLQIFSQ